MGGEVPVAFGPIPGLAGDGVGGSGRRDGGEGALAELPVGLALPRSDRGCGKVFWRRQTWDTVPQPLPVLNIALATGAHQPH